MKMEHLIELLNAYSMECNSDISFVDYDTETNSFEVLDDWKVVYLWDETVLCLRFGFIDWLFEIGEIDMVKCMEDEDFKTLMKDYEAPDAALMCLATRYSNIDLLLSRLKEWKEKE